MVFWTSISQDKAIHRINSNEDFRVRHHYKEMEVHNAPPRKNRDFKPVLYGDFIGMLNFKLAEPWGMLRHFDDLFEEKHHKPIQWIRAFVKG